MKAKLILKHRGDYDYFLVSRTDNSEALVASLNPDEEIFEQRLSTKNCDEIFGVVDLDKLAEEDCSIHHPYHPVHDQTTRATFIRGFNKAMELNKDKVFTLEDMGNLWDFCTYNKGTFAEFIQQITEIEVEIIMKNSRTGNIVKHDSDLEWDEDGLCDRAIPKLDSEGCLVLTKKI